MPRCQHNAWKRECRKTYSLLGGIRKSLNCRCICQIFCELVIKLIFLDIENKGWMEGLGVKLT